MTDLLQVGDPIVRDEMSPSDWDAYVAELRQGDEVEYWEGSYGYQMYVRRPRITFSGDTSEFTLIERCEL